MKKIMFTEKDILEFLDGTFQGNKEDIQLYIEQNPGIKEKSGFYKNLFALLKQDDTVHTASLNLADRVVTQIRKKQDLQYAKEENFIKACIAVIGLVVTYWVLQQFSFNVTQLFESILIAVTVLFIVLTVAFTKAEINARKKIFSSVH